MLILGGGIAGLAAAWATGAPVYEAEDEVGGTCRSRRVGGFVFDYGIHVLQTADATVHDVFRQAGVCLGTQNRVANIYSHGRYTAYPFQVNTAGLPIALRLRCLWKYFSRDRHTAAENYEQWIYSNVGEGFGDTFLIPYSEKFWTVHPREMTHEWTGDHVPQPSAWQVLRGAFINTQTAVGSNAVFQYPQHGSGYRGLTDLMGQAIGEVHLNHRATRIDAVARTIEFNGGQKVLTYETLISTIPLPVLVGLIADAPDAVRRAAGLLRCNSMFVVNLGIDLPSPTSMNWAHFPERDISFCRISYPHNFGKGMAREGTHSITAEVAYSRHRPIDKSTIVDEVIRDLVRVGALAEDAPIAVRDVMDIEFGYVIYDMNRARAVRTIHDWLQTAGIVPTGRYGRWEFLWSHEALLAGLDTARSCAPSNPTAD